MDLRPSHVIAIDHKGRVIVGFVTKENSQELATKTRPGLVFHILRFNTKGIEDLTLPLSTNNWHDNAIYLDQADDVIARANDMLQMLKSDGQHQNWEDLLACGPACWVTQSSSHGTLRILNAGSDPPVTILQGSPPNATRCGRGGYLDDFTDHFAFSCKGGGWPMPPPVLYRWPICDPDHKTQTKIQSGDVGGVFPLNDKTIVLTGFNSFNHHRATVQVVAVISADGDTIFRVPLPKSDQAEGWVQGDENGDRFAVSIATWHGGSRWLDISGNRVARRIAVYETATSKELASFSVTPHALIDLAMSPDGHRVAVLANDTMTIADVP